MFDRPHLHALAEHVGILGEYTDIDGVVRRTSDASFTMLLEAMGYPAATEQAAVESLQQIEAAERARVLQPVCVVPQSALRAHAFTAWALPSQTAPILCRAALTEESGQEHGWEWRAEPANGRLHLAVPVDLPLGYHRLDLTLLGHGELCAHQTLIVVPDRCWAPANAQDFRRFGICANLYTVRSEPNFGVGDFGDLAALARWAAGRGAAFLGLNPLHALRNTGHDISPYSPLSRLFRNVIYLDVTAVPEFQSSREAHDLLRSADFERALAACRSADRVEYESVLGLKLQVMRALHDELLKGGSAVERRRAHEEFVREQGDALEEFATFSALDSWLKEQGRGGDWRNWPGEYRDHRSSAVAQFRDAHRAEISFHKYLQFELDRQLQQASKGACDGGMSIGLYQDVAIGTAPGGADAWAYPELFVEGARIGAPPDGYSIHGQDWGLPPIHPVRMREDSYRYFRRLLQANMAHSGALRIDHVMGLLRQYWIPPGASALEGAYVRYPAEDLFGVLALESVRHRAWVIGEDLGTVPAGFTELLARQGILSCQVLYFERDQRGAFKPPTAYSDRALVTSTTHDHPSLASFWRGDDLVLRRRIGDIDSDERLEAARRHRDHDRRALLRALRLDETLAGGDLPYAELCAAVHHFLASTPAPLLGLMLDDLTAELEPINLPGVGPSQHDCWRRRMRMSLETIMSSAEVASGIRGAEERAERR